MTNKQIKFKCPACRGKSLTMTPKPEEGVKFWFCYKCKYNKRTELPKKTVINPKRETKEDDERND